jgi:hypothetical protein
MDYNTFLGGKEVGLYKDRRGEFYFYQIRQFLARYYMERLTNGLGEIPGNIQVKKGLIFLIQIFLLFLNNWKD